MRAYINSMEWEFAKSMPQWPHWYVLREDGSAREFDFVNRLIKNSDIANLPIATSSLPRSSKIYKPRSPDSPKSRMT